MTVATSKMSRMATASSWRSSSCKWRVISGRTDCGLMLIHASIHIAAGHARVDARQNFVRRGVQPLRQLLAGDALVALRADENHLIIIVSRIPANVHHGLIHGHL